MYKIQAVDVFPLGAKFSFTVSPEEDNFSIELPGAFDADSVRIINLADTEDVRIFTAKRIEWIPSSLEALKADIDAHQRRAANFQAQTSALSQTLELLAKAAPPKRTNAEDIISYIRMAQEMKLKTENELASIQASMKEENERVALLASELQERMPSCADEAVYITGRLKSGKTIAFEAFTTCAAWTPKYTMDLDTKTGAIMTRLYARSSQSTGLDYTGQITFHTRTPDSNVIAPEAISPLKVLIRPKPVQQSARRPRRYMEVAAKADYSTPMPYADEDEEYEDYAETDLPDLLGQDLDQPMMSYNQISAPETSETLTDHSVKCSGSLIGDGRESELFLGDIKLTGKIHLELVPEQRSDAWIIAEMEDVSKPLIPGEAVLRVDEHQTGSVSIPEYGLSRQNIPFGYVPGITARKERISGQKTTSWFNLSQEGYTISITNDMREDQTVIVRDRMPVSKGDKIKLDVTSISPEPEERTEDNLLTWRLGVKAGETVTVAVNYTLSYPLGEEVEYR